MNNEEAIKVLNNSIERRVKQVDLIEALMNDSEMRDGYIREQKAIIASLSVTLEQLMSSESVEPKPDLFANFPKL